MSCSLASAASGRDEAFVIEYRRDLAIHLVFSIQLANSSRQRINVDVIAVGVNAPLYVMVAGCAGLPEDLGPHLTLGPLLIKNDFADDKSQNALAIGCRRGGRIPNPRQVLAERL